MKQVKIVSSVLLSLLCLIDTMDAKSSTPSSSLSWSNREIIEAVCLGSLCCLSIGTIFYINRLEKRIEEQNKRINVQDKRITQQNSAIARQTDEILNEKMNVIELVKSVNDLKKSHEASLMTFKTYDEKITALQQQQRRYKKRLVSLELWQDDALNTKRFYSYSFSSASGAESE